MRGIPLGSNRATFEAFEERVERSALYAHLDYPEDEQDEQGEPDDDGPVAEMFPGTLAALDRLTIRSEHR